ncbi:MAG: sugar transferase [Pegethrix bostrychoides GSE-TBD4-15B]|jgi:lipopolysaccharide/colanic/teichoic acid biosynthesis glycosyltransferase|uniref:Sugar transferase n=1 Tax=Pegethrix bostrychoides GSE-TBD4-15B TaxID=2839662 RepID=A0A951PFF5_9CYAN|nr:sugar transferase [Pegethrix bostrychoides GSE-TBD4-15B]
MLDPAPQNSEAGQESGTGGSGLTSSSDATASAAAVGAIHPSAVSPIKRSIDLAGSVVGLLALGLLFLPIAVAIKLDSLGPVLYRQQRFGLQGKPFTILKFRSMVQNADALKAVVQNEANGLIFKNKQDPRITRVGRFLRKTSLDELPQFWNVFRGEMSLVGTRPPTQDEVSRYRPHHWQRLSVKPGITGEWQVHGRSTVKDFEQVLKLDLRYQQRWTPLYDLVLIWRTLIVLLNKTGAY